MRNMADMVKVEHLKKNFGDLEVLKDINLTVAEGEKLVIICICHCSQEAAVSLKL